MTVWVDLGLTLVVIGISYVVKRYRDEIRTIFEIVNEIEKALDDGTLTEQELKEIIKQIKSVIKG